jgi:hypothetical protein
MVRIRHYPGSILPTHPSVPFGDSISGARRGGLSPLRHFPLLRAVLLGASNLKMGLPAVLRHLRRAAGGPVEVLAACGHGRSYVQWSRILFGARALPGIASCGLWRALAGRPALPTLALVMDAGNDLLYGPAVEEIAAGFGGCLERLKGLGAGVVAMPLPMVSLEKISTVRYHAARTILFPGRGEPWAPLLERARELDRRLRGLAAEHGARLVEPQAAWYGIDPIHFRRSRRRQAWDHIAGQWPSRAPETAPDTLRFRIPPLGAEELRLFGAVRHTLQPVCRLPDGSTLALY